jgi:hypothetical protein
MYKAEREAAYKALEQQVCDQFKSKFYCFKTKTFLFHVKVLGSKTSIEDSIQIRTEDTIKSMEITYEKNKDRVLKDVLALFSKIEPKTHINLYNQ